MEEISLKELIQILLKGKFLIILTTVIFTILGVAVSFILPRSYTATLTLMVNPINANAIAGISDLNSLLNAMNDAAPQASIATYKEQITSNEVLSAAREILNKDLSEDDSLSVDDLNKLLNIELIPNTNLLNIEAKNKDPEFAAKIANTVGESFIKFISDKNREAAEIVSQTIEINLVAEAVNLDEQAKRLRDYLTNSANIDALSGEVGVLISQISSYKSALINVKNDIEITRNTLAVLMDEWNVKTDMGDIAVNYNVSTGSPEIMLDLANENILRDVLLTVETTNLNTNLIKNLESEKTLTTKIVELESRLSELQATLADERYKYNSIQREYGLAEQTYSAYQTKYKEAIISAVSDVGQVTLQVSSTAIPPENPEGVGKIVVVAVAGLLGAMISVFAVFFMEYWKTADDYKTLEVNSIVG